MTSWYIRYLKGYYHHFMIALSWRINGKSNRFQMIFSDHVACCVSGVPRSRWGSFWKLPMVLSIGSWVVGLAFQLILELRVCDPGMSGSKMKHVNVHSKDSSKPKLRWVFLNLKKSASVKPLQSLPICAGQEMFLLKYLFETSGHSHYTFFSEFLALALPTRCLQPNSTLHRSVQ